MVLKLASTGVGRVQVLLRSGLIAVGKYGREGVGHSAPCCPNG